MQVDVPARRGGGLRETEAEEDTGAMSSPPGVDISGTVGGKYT